jgi:monoamine oxidase
MPTLFTALRAQHREKPHRARIPEVSPKEAEEGRSAPLLRADLSKLFTSQLADIPRLPSDKGLEPGGVLAVSDIKHPQRKVAVIGAGLSGLAAAYELNGLGYDVRVFEARSRVGGRVESLTDFAANKTVEGGGELIGSNHALWNSYRVKFGLEFSDVKEYKSSPYRLRNRTLSYDESSKLMDELDHELKALSDLAETLIDAYEPWSNPNSQSLDKMTLSEWVQGRKCSKLCKDAIELMMAADNGIPADEQSLLGILAMVKGGGLDRYWTDSELYRCKNGNQRLAEAFREALDRERTNVHCGTPIRKLVRRDGGIALLNGDQRELALVDDVILAVPPSVWNKIDISEFPVLREKLSKPPAMGHNVKALMRISSRFWEDYGSSPTLSQDGPVDLTWETTEADKAKDFVMVAFSGAADADKCISWSDADRRERYIKALSAVYPRLDETLDAFEFKDWPTTEWSLASYYFPRPGEVLEWGPFWKTGFEGWLHFAGEHTCYAFVGYMEGALASGYRLARRLAIRDNVLPG